MRVCVCVVCKRHCSALLHFFRFVIITLHINNKNVIKLFGLCKKIKKKKKDHWFTYVHNSAKYILKEHINQKRRVLYDANGIKQTEQN